MKDLIKSNIRVVKWGKVYFDSFGYLKIDDFIFNGESFDYLGVGFIMDMLEHIGMFSRAKYKNYKGQEFSGRGFWFYTF